MKKLLFASLLFLLAIQAMEASPLCPATLADWKTWRDRSISTLLQPRMTQNNELFLDTAQVLATSVEIANYIDDCAPSFTPTSALNAEIGNLRIFTNVLRNNLSVPVYDHQFGYTIDDFDYLDKVKENVDLPDLLKSPTFLAKISNRSTYQDALKMINDLNATLPSDKQWLVLIYKSRFLTTPDAANTFGRFFVLVPGDKY